MFRLSRPFVLLKRLGASGLYPMSDYIVDYACNSFPTPTNICGIESSISKQNSLESAHFSKWICSRQRPFESNRVMHTTHWNKICLASVARTFYTLTNLFMAAVNLVVAVAGTVGS